MAIVLFMPLATPSLGEMIPLLVRALSRSLAQEFNVFRVMHHGTHEKQLSNVFAWLLRPDGTHELGDVFQRIFVAQINGHPRASSQLPLVGYRVAQEVDTSGHEALGRDIADIVLSTDDSTIVVENYETSDGHGHGYKSYLDYGAAGGKSSVVVLLCTRHEAYRQLNGWDQAVVVTYTELLESLNDHIKMNAAWQRANPRQRFFIDELVRHFVEGPAVVSNVDRVAFMRTMCETGESSRYGQRPHEVAAQSFADEMALHAKRQFEDGRKMLWEVKSILRRFSQSTLVAQINEIQPSAQLGDVVARYVGQWEWCVELKRSGRPSISLEFGPTAVVENGRAPAPVPDPDYSKVFVTRNIGGGDGIDLIVQTDVGLDEVLAGLSADDTRLRDAVLAAVEH